MNATIPARMNPIQALEIVKKLREDIEAGRADPVFTQGLVNTIVLEIPQWFLEFAANVHQSINKKLGVAPSAEIPAEEAPAAAPAVVSGKPRMSASGEPMDAQQAALEAMMDAAETGMPINEGTRVAPPPPNAPIVAPPASAQPPATTPAAAPAARAAQAQAAAAPRAPNMGPFRAPTPAAPKAKNDIPAPSPKA